MSALRSDLRSCKRKTALQQKQIAEQQKQIAEQQKQTLDYANRLDDYDKKNEETSRKFQTLLQVKLYTLLHTDTSRFRVLVFLNESLGFSSYFIAEAHDMTINKMYIINILSDILNYCYRFGKGNVIDMQRCTKIPRLRVVHNVESDL